jgi:hypothetical protein
MRTLEVEFLSVIRTLGFIELYALCLVHEQRRNPNRYQWDILSMGNGKCTIKNVGVDSFLATAQRRDGQWEPILSSTVAQEWIIQSTSEFTHS